MQTWPDGRIKLFLTKHLLQLRRGHADLFERGEYLPLHTSGTFAESCVSFVRRLDDNWIAVIAPRLSSRIGFPPIGEAWQDTAIQLPETLVLEKAHDLFTCTPVSVAGTASKAGKSIGGATLCSNHQSVAASLCEARS